MCGKVNEEPTLKTDNHHGQNSLTDACRCPAVKDCGQCADDLDAMLTTPGFAKQLLRHQCTVHGDYRTYQDVLVRLKSWTILWVSVSIVPYGLLLIQSGVDLNWVFLTGCIMTIPCFPGVVLSIVWSKATARGMTWGVLIGVTSGVVATLARASTLPGGLGDFLHNTSEGYTVMTGSCTSFFVTLVVTIIISLITHHIKTQEDAFAEWQKVRDIDNPLNPWMGYYREEFPDMKNNEKPSYKQLEMVFRKAKILAIVGSIVGVLLFVVFIPGVMASLRVLNETEFRSWVMTMHVWCFVMAAIVIVVTPFEEIRAICTELKRKKIYMNREYDKFQSNHSSVVGNNHTGLSNTVI